MWSACVRDAVQYVKDVWHMLMGMLHRVICDAVRSDM